MNPRVYYRVIVRHNLVAEIHPVSEAETGRIEDDPLAVSTKLAQNNRNNGRLDGEYDFETYQAARHFSKLCVEFLQGVSDRSLEEINKSEAPNEKPWRNPFIPSSGS